MANKTSEEEIENSKLSLSWRRLLERFISIRIKRNFINRLLSNLVKICFLQAEKMQFICKIKSFLNSYNKTGGFIANIKADFNSDGEIR